MFRSVLLVLMMTLSVSSGAQFQGLIVNEFSQGNTGSREYIEILVVGNHTCTDSTADIRGWIIDDQNGWYGTGSITPGHYRFRDIPTWSAVPFGSIILLYNSASGEKNLSIAAADDPSDANKDFIYILPINSSSYLEEHDAQPNVASTTAYVYPPATSTAGYAGTSNTWIGHIALNNTGDVISLISPSNRSTSFFAVGFGFLVNAGFLNPSVSIPGVGAGHSAYLSSSSYNFPGDWVIGPVPAGETPGQPNGGVNTTWISGMRSGRPEITLSPLASPVCESNTPQYSSVAYSDPINSPVFYHLTWHPSTPNGFNQSLSSLSNGIGFYVPAGAPPGTYTGYITVSNLYGVSCLDSFTVSVLPSLSAPQVTLIQPTCTGAGSIQVISPAGSGISFSIDGVNYQNNGGLFSNVLPGSYQVTAKNAAGCLSPGTTAIINAAPGLPPAPTITVVNHCDGTSTLTANGATGSLLWSNGATNNPLVVTIAGSYTVTQTVNGCTSVPASAVAAPRTSPPVPVLSIVQPSCTLPTGTITINSPLGSNYVYSINGSSYTAVTQYTGLVSNNYTIGVRNMEGCSSTASATVQPPPLTPAAPVLAIIQPDCATATGSIQVSPAAAGYSYSIDGINFTNTSGSFTAMTPGTYFITARSSEGCISSPTLAIISPQPVTPIVLVNSPTICPGMTATLSATVSPAGSYNYVWTVPAGAGNPGNVAGFTSNVAGTYSVVITQPNRCSATASGTLSINSLATVMADDKQVCASTAVTLTGQPAGGTWSGTGVSGLQFDAAGLTPGNYTVTYTVTSGSCSGAANAVITVRPLPLRPNISVSNQCNGISVLTASGYSGSLLWSTGATTPSITVGVAGNYTLAQIVNGCSSTAAQAFANPLSPPAVPMIVSLRQPDCSNPGGSVTVSTTGTGITYSIPALSMINTTGLFTNLPQGTHLVTAVNSEGCMSPPISINIQPPPTVPLSPTTQVVHPDCSGTRGSINVQSPTGADLTYSIDGLNYQPSPVFANLSPGNYLVQVRNSAGCVSPAVAVQILSASGAVSGSITACIAEGGSYNFNGQVLTTTGFYSTTYVRPNNCDSLVRLYLVVAQTKTRQLASCGRVAYNGNNYVSSVTLRDTVASLVTNCDSLYRVIQIIVHPEPVVTTTVCLPAGQTYNFNGQVLTRSGRYTGNFTTVAGCDSTVHLLLTVASQQIKNVSACGVAVLNGIAYTSDTTLTQIISATLSSCDSIIRITNIVVTPKPALIVSSGKTICKGESVQLRATAGAATIEWQGIGVGNEVIVTPTATTTYVAIATAAPGCTAISDVTIRVDELNLQLTATPNPVIAGQTISIKSSASSSYQVLRWQPVFANPAAIQQPFVADTSVVVRVWARSSGGCLDSAFLHVIVDPLGDVYIPTAFTPNGDGRNDLFTVAGGRFKMFQLRIFNRLGQVVFQSAERSKPWNGTVAGKDQPGDTYVYVLKATLMNGKLVDRKGTVTLIR